MQLVLALIARIVLAGKSAQLRFQVQFDRDLFTTHDGTDRRVNPPVLA